ncbi:DUF3168 domain-containing protein [Devosia sp.]|uniref:DUF3168 domain-containing protein n=1 Tax=Devosia sp. TaxID=1871048 RepID=UPI001ACCECB2|nr:DUF3168 domain-containing protein [Devosia sp.]MBN9333626.1 DUF3168 domain-containing protein [Devosia sp.]
MTDQAYYVQKAVYERLVATPALVDLVPVANIVDDLGGLPTVFPGIILGEGQIVDEGQRIDRSVKRVYLTCHLWTAEPRLNEVKKIGGAFAAAIETSTNGGSLGGGFYLGDLRIRDVRYIRDPSGQNGHGVVTVDTLVGRA